jgi:hypothetical protein
MSWAIWLLIPQADPARASGCYEIASTRSSVLRHRVKFLGKQPRFREAAAAPVARTGASAGSAEGTNLFQSPCARGFLTRPTRRRSGPIIVTQPLTCYGTGVVAVFQIRGRDHENRHRIHPGIDYSLPSLGALFAVSSTQIVRGGTALPGAGQLNTKNGGTLYMRRKARRV